MIAAVARRLVDGADAETAIAALRETYTTTASLSTAMSLVRAAVLEAERVVDDAPLRAHARHPEVAAFLALPLREQYRLQREHARNPTWPPEAEAALAALRLLPPNMDGFALTRRETLDLKRRREEAQLARQEAPLVVADAPRLLRAATAMLASATASTSFPRLILPLLLVSGRRFAEVVNGRSSFTPTAHPYLCIFNGQLKKRGRAQPYTIPLLVPFAAFERALRVLREKQGGAELANGVAKDRYGANAQRALADGVLVGLPSCHLHDLRSAYVALVDHVYQCPFTFNRLAMRILGHDCLTESLCYNHVKLAGGSRGSLGPLRLD